MDAQPYRLAEGGRIDRSRALRFNFNGKRYFGCAGDTLASALLANGIMLVGRSQKYHRPRGFLSAGSEEPNALVQVRDGASEEPNLKATEVELYDGLSARSVNCWPGVGFDLGAVSGRFAPLLPAGFYYKTFMWPTRSWRLYEYFIRRAAGFGTSPRQPDPGNYETIHRHCDVLVVGGGPAGLGAALAASRGGAHVMLVNDAPEFGGALLSTRATIDAVPALDWVASTLATLRASPRVELLSRANAFGYYDHNYIAIVERVGDPFGRDESPARVCQRLWQVRADHVILATGAHERALVFADNDRPGIMLASAARSYVNRYAVRPGRRAVIFTNNDSAYAAALDIADGGIGISAIVDARADPKGAPARRARDRGIRVLGGHAIVGTRGAKRVAAARIMKLAADGESVSGRALSLDCDLICMSGGWNPALQLFSQSGGRSRYDPRSLAFIPDTSYRNRICVGAANGAADLAECLAQGHAAGADAARRAGFGAELDSRAPRSERIEGEASRPLWLVPAEPRRTRGAKRFVDFQGDVTEADIALAVREGYRSIELVKRYTAATMGTDQGRTANLNASAILARATGVEIGAVGMPTFRPPQSPVRIGAIAGRRASEDFQPERRLPLQDWHERAGAVFECVGQWRRPLYYPKPNEEMTAAVARECAAARTGLGLIDLTTLGKIDIQGADAPAFLNLVYTNDWNSLKVGSCRYGMMLTEAGMVFDDGVTSRLGAHHYLMSTSSGNAERVAAWLEEWLQTEWPRLSVYLTVVTEQYVTIGLVGPRARDLLAGLADGIDLHRESFPFMSVRIGTVAGISARVFRVSFTGELSYEINVPARHGAALWRKLLAAGEEYEITPFGTEALHVLRAEKGYIIVGQDSDGTVTPGDLGMDWLVSKKKKADFIGKRSLELPDMKRSGRKQLVGLLAEDASFVLPEGSPIVAEKKKRPPMKAIGHVTSSYFSVCLDRSIALALLARGRERLGETVSLYVDGRFVSATVTAPRFYDPDGDRLRG